MTQNSGLRSSSRSSAGTARNTSVAPTNVTVLIDVASTIDGCLRCRSTYVPNTGPRTAAEMLNAPPITPVTTTDRVSRNTQNVSANHRNELVTPLTSEFSSNCRNVRSASAWRTGVSIAPCVVSSHTVIVGSDDVAAADSSVLTTTSQAAQPHSRSSSIRVFRRIRVSRAGRTRTRHSHAPKHSDARVRTS